MLVDLSIVDMLLRKALLPLTIDIEHFAKVSLLGTIEAAGEDGYGIVEDFLDANPAVENEIDRGKPSVYIDGLLSKYSRPGFPVWAFVEVISFGVFCHFYRFCAERFSDPSMRSRYYLLMEAKSFGNACAHNNCILNDLSTNGHAYNRGLEVTRTLARVPGIGRSQRRHKMKNRRISQIVTVLYLHSLLASDGVKQYVARDLNKFLERMNKSHRFCKGADSVVSTFGFISSVVECWYTLAEND